MLVDVNFEHLERNLDVVAKDSMQRVVGVVHFFRFLREKIEIASSPKEDIRICLYSLYPSGKIFSVDYFPYADAVCERNLSSKGYVVDKFAPKGLWIVSETADLYVYFHENGVTNGETNIRFQLRRSGD